MKNVVSPVDAEDEQDNSGGYRVPKILERLKLMNKQKRNGRNSKGKVPRKIRGSSNIDDVNKNRNRTHQHATSHKKNAFDTAKNKKMEDICETSKKISKSESRNVSKKGNSKRKTKPKNKRDGQSERNSQIPEENDGRKERKLHNKKSERKKRLTKYNS